MADFIVGVVGGLGPATSAEFYTKVVSGVLQKTKRQPSIVIDSVPMSSADIEMISKAPSEKVFKKLEASVERLSRIPVDLIVIPCNTVHIYFERLQKGTNVPILNIIEETTAALRSLGISRVGVIATTTTIKSQLYQRSFEKGGITGVLPCDEEQQKITKTVIRILDERATFEETDFLNGVINKLASDGAEAVVLGCTDLQLLIKEHRKAIIVDSMESLANATIGRITRLNQF